ncbi:MAG: T9SS type A sorting domain-containing protein [Candidatus Marinimicrobia bacterium]|nr:T9SS type A sorting domain-containing protein [Candidatus Neomarinimicrobiota bacterium]
MQHIIILFLFATYFQPIFASDFTIEEAAYKIINRDTDIHYSEILRVIAKHGHQLPLETQIELQARGFDFSRQIVSSYRPQSLDNYVDEGIFRFHYTLTGSDAVSPLDADNNGIPDYVDLIVTTFANIGMIDFTDMEFVRPPGDGWYTQIDDGGSDHYDVYIFNLETGYYGYVQAEDYAQNNSPITRGDNEFSEGAEEERAMVTFMALRNNYNDFSGIESEIIEVTSAHEFFHAVQYGYDGWEAGWLLEATAVWMEEHHYDNINDCYQFLQEFFNEPYLAINYDVNRGYGAYIYFAYLTDNRVSNDLIRRVFERSREYNSYDVDYSIPTLMAALNDYNLDFETVTHDFFFFFCMLFNSDSAGIYQYSESNTFPMDLPTLEQTITASNDTTLYYYNQPLETFSALYYLVDTQDSTWNNLVIDLLTEDSNNMRYYVTSIVEHKNDSTLNTYDVLTAQTQTIDVSGVDSIIFVVSAFGYDIINSEFSMRIIKNSSVEMATDMEFIPISNQYLLNNPYPNPFNAHVTIHYTIPNNQPVNISIYDILGNKIRHFQSKHLGKQSIIWNGKDQYGIPVSSGMYIVNMSADSFTQSRRILLLK